MPNKVFCTLLLFKNVSFDKKKNRGKVKTKKAEYTILPDSACFFYYYCDKSTEQIYPLNKFYECNTIRVQYSLLQALYCTDLQKMFILYN